MSEEKEKVIVLYNPKYGIEDELYEDFLKLLEIPKNRYTREIVANICFAASQGVALANLDKEEIIIENCPDENIMEVTRKTMNTLKGSENFMKLVDVWKKLLELGVIEKKEEKEVKLELKHKTD